MEHEPWTLISRASHSPWLEMPSEGQMHEGDSLIDTFTSIPVHGPSHFSYLGQDMGSGRSGHQQSGQAQTNSSDDEGSLSAAFSNSLGSEVDDAVDGPFQSGLLRSSTDQLSKAGEAEHSAPTGISTSFPLDFGNGSWNDAEFLDQWNSSWLNEIDPTWLLFDDLPLDAYLENLQQHNLIETGAPTQQPAEDDSFTGNLNTTGAGTVEAAAQASTSASKRKATARSPSPGQDIREAIAKATVCFQVEGPNSSVINPRKARKTFDTQERKKVADVRSKKSCLRCRWLKTSCDGQTPCAKCVAARNSSNVKLYVGPCMRLNLTEADCFRVGNSKFLQEIAEVRPYPYWKMDAAPRTLQLIRPRIMARNWPSGSDYPTLDIKVREFKPGPEDLTCERWRDASGREIILELPCLAAVDNQGTTQALLSWVDNNFHLYARDMVTQGGDFIISATFDEAVRYSMSRPESIVKEALRIWIGSRMAQEFFTVQENNDLGIELVRDPSSVHDQQCPVPPVLDHQLDVLMIVEMIKMKNRVLDLVRKMIEDRRRNQWYEVYLTIFVFLANLQYVFAKQKWYWKLHDETGIGNIIGRSQKSYFYKFMQRYEYSAKNMIAHFRYALRGPVPFTLDWSKENVANLGELDTEAVTYVKFISSTVQRRAHELRSVAQDAKKGIYEGDLFWLCELFLEPDIDDNWQPVEMREDQS